MKNRQLSQCRHALFYFEALIEKGAAAKLDATRMPPLAFKLIVTAVGNFADRPTDGMIVCPIACLAP